MPMYIFKFTPEFWWSLLQIVATALSAAVISQGALPPNDWRVWAVGAVAGLVRAVGGFILSQFASSNSIG